MKFEFSTSPRIIFGEKVVQQIGQIAVALGKSAFVITGASPQRVSGIFSELESRRVPVVHFSVSGEPTLENIRSGTRILSDAGCDLVIGIGGGSAIDAAKAVSAMAANSGDPLDYIEVIGGEKPLANPPLPIIAVPTTAGTGAEVTRNAVISSPNHRVKASLRSDLIYPRVALVDPELTYSMPPELTATTGFDALTQLIEPFVSSKANPFVDSFCREGMRRVGRSLQKAFLEGNDVSARCDMSLASLFGGLALANAGLGAVHGLAGTIGGGFNVPHGAVCARLLPEVLTVNFRALSTRFPGGKLISKFTEIARILTDNPAADALSGITWIRDACENMKIHSLSSFGLSPASFPAIIEQAKSSSSMKGNPVALTDEEIIEILSLSL